MSEGAGREDFTNYFCFRFSFILLNISDYGRVISGRLCKAFVEGVLSKLKK